MNKAIIKAMAWDALQELSKTGAKHELFNTAKGALNYDALLSVTDMLENNKRTINDIRITAAMEDEYTPVWLVWDDKLDDMVYPAEIGKR